jgi:hypothetical protein
VLKDPQTDFTFTLPGCSLNKGGLNATEKKLFGRGRSIKLTGTLQLYVLSFVPVALILEFVYRYGSINFEFIKFIYIFNFKCNGMLTPKSIGSYYFDTLFLAS